MIMLSARCFISRRWWSQLSVKDNRRSLRVVAASRLGETGNNHSLCLHHQTLPHRHLSSSQAFQLESISGQHGSYLQEYNRSVQDPQAFWRDAARNIHWFQEPTEILANRSHNFGLYEWFRDGVTNTSFNCLDRHVIAGRANQPALIYDSPVTGVKATITYQELLDQVATFAGALKNELQIQTGDRVIIYCPHIPEAIVAMLACTRIGAVHSVVFGGFAAPELAARIRDCRPKVVIAASSAVERSRVIPYKPLVDRAIELAELPQKPTCVVIQRENVGSCELGPNDVDYNELMGRARPVEALPVPSIHPHYVLYTSGTTGLPKGILRDTGSYAVALKYSMSAFYDTNPGETFWAASDIGWVVGHSYIVYAPLLHGCTTVLYEGKPVGTPDAGAFWRVIEEHQVKTLFAAPTAFRAIKQADPLGKFVQKHDLSCFKYLFLAGEHCDPATLNWCERALGEYGDIPVIDHWWQTELGWPGVGNAVGLGQFPIRYGACAAPVPGFALEVMDDDGKVLPCNQLGNLVIKLPLPPGTLATLYQNEKRYVQSYLARFDGYYDTGDAGYVDDDGYVYIMGRTDDVINTAGHRLSTGAMEEILMDHPDIAECAVIGVNDDLKGQVPVGFVTLVGGSKKDHTEIIAELIARVRETLGPVASFRKVGIVKALPKTRSGKILRGTMSRIANKMEYSVTPTVEDPNIFEYLAPEITMLVES